MQKSIRAVFQTKKFRMTEAACTLDMHRRITVSAIFEENLKEDQLSQLNFKAYVDQGQRFRLPQTLNSRERKSIKRLLEKLLPFVLTCDRRVQWASYSRSPGGIQKVHELFISDAKPNVLSKTADFF